MKRAMIGAIVLAVGMVCTQSGASPLQPWSMDGSLPTDVSGRYMIAVGDYWYAMVGDYDHQGHTETMYSKFEPNGRPGPWLSTSSRSIERYVYRTEEWNNRIYVVGGQANQFGPPLPMTRTTEFATIQANGSLSNWQTSSALNIGRTMPGVTAYNGCLYAVGGHDANILPLKSVEYSAIAADGTLGSWTFTSATQTAHPYSVSAAYNGYLYIFSGAVASYQTATVERAPINADGTLGAWVYDTSLPVARGDMGIIQADNTIYLLGGNNTGGNLTSVIWSEIQPDHTLGPWQTTSSLLVSNTSGHGDMWGDYLYATGRFAGIEITTPEPGTIALVSIGAMMLLKRRSGRALTRQN
jgi:hypothetical protein